ncbi:claspin-like isoform X1 [Pseudochaenichthys georgianus]|uniref:claspin-like isoform X1 n=1 Tax=Pseudochaenichthys georgianus TaxID=52239 RepID=UPI00146EC723|nr:uncharacterized protein LOC117452034 [Pseudochaenichthys georgianus]
MAAVEKLRSVINERLAAAADEIFGVFSQTLSAYEDEICRQCRLLDTVLKPQIKLHKTELPQQHVCNEDEDLTDQQLCSQERNSSLDQEDPEPPQIKEEQEELCTSQEEEQLGLKQETDVFMVTLTDEESVHSSQTCAKESVGKPQIKLHRTELPQQHVCNEDEVLTDQQLCSQERNSSLDQEDPEPPQIKEELCTSQEEEQLKLKQETDIFMVTLTDEVGRGRRKKLAGKYRTQKRKAEETEDLEVQEDSTESPTRERKGRKCKKDVSPCPSKTPEWSPEGSRSPQRSERSPQQSERSHQQSRWSPQQSQESLQHSPSPPPPLNRQPESSDDEDESASPALPAGKSKSKPEVGKGDKGKGKAQNENPPPGASYSFTEAQEEAIARWVQSNKLLYDMKDKQYKYKALRRQLWEGKAAENGVDYHSIQKWYHTQRTRFSKLREGQPKKKSQKRFGYSLSSGDEEDPILASENDSDRDKFIRRVFGFMKPHIRRHKKDTPASFKDKLALAETGELAGSDEPREPTKKYTGYPTPRPPSRTGTAAEDRPESPTMEMRVTGASRDLQDRLVQFITREQQVNRTTPFCKYLETELDRLHDACLEPAYEEIITVLNHYRKVSRQFRMREAAGDQISPLEDVPSAFQSQQPQQQRPVAVIPVCTSATYSRVGMGIEKRY